MNEPQMMIPWWPFIAVAVVWLFAAGRTCRSRRSGAGFVTGIAILGLLLLTAGLLLAAILLIGRAPPASQPVTERKIEESYWPLAPAHPRQIPLELDSGPLVERPESAPNPSSSVAPSENDSLSTKADRPAWMDAKVGRIDDSNIYRMRITVGPYLSRAECEKELPEALQKAVRDYATGHLGEEKAARVSLPGWYIDEHIVKGEWEERRQMTIEEFVYLHELLEFDVEAKRRIEAGAVQAVVNDRLMYTAAAGGAVLGLLTIFFAFLKLDTLTRGLYTGRLRLTATAAILAIAVIAGLLVMA